jgi:hypothetical protein
MVFEFYLMENRFFVAIRKVYTRSIRSVQVFFIDFVSLLEVFKFFHENPAFFMNFSGVRKVRVVLSQLFFD